MELIKGVDDVIPVVEAKEEEETVFNNEGAVCVPIRVDVDVDALIVEPVPMTLVLVTKPFFVAAM